MPSQNKCSEKYLLDLGGCERLHLDLWQRGGRNIGKSKEEKLHLNRKLEINSVM
jgi:hypothetical protein